jgi:hypothetical protein
VLTATNTVEGFFGFVRRDVFWNLPSLGPRGYLQYLKRTDFRYDHRNVNDSERTMLHAESD